MTNDEAREELEGLHAHLTERENENDAATIEALDIALGLFELMEKRRDQAAELRWHRERYPLVQEVIRSTRDYEAAKPKGTSMEEFLRRGSVRDRACRTLAEHENSDER